MSEPEFDLFELMKQWREEDTEEDIVYMRALLAELEEGKEVGDG